MKPGLYKAHGGRMMIVASVARKYLRAIRITAGELQVCKMTEQQLLQDRYEPCANPPLLIAIEKFTNNLGGVSEAALAALLTLKEINMDVKTATTQELVAFYNKHSEAPIKKFTDRATAEKRVQLILDAIAAKEAVKPKPKAEQKKEKGLPKSTVHVTKTSKSGKEEKTETHRSAYQAFESYGLPLSKHKKLRVELKANKKATFEHDGAKYEFTA